MFHDHENKLLKNEEFADLGTDVVAYMREITGTEILDTFPGKVELDEERNYWALFAANGSPLMVAEKAGDVINGAFYNDLRAVLPS